MKCAYRQVQEKQIMDDANDKLITLYRGISILALRSSFGFGIGRYSLYCCEVVENIGELVDRYMESGPEGKMEGVFNGYYAARIFLKDAGVEIEKIESRFAPEKYVKKIGGKHTKNMTADRLKYLKDVDRSFSVIWYVSMLWLREKYGYGGIKLGRYYTECRRMFSEFTKCYLNFDDTASAKMISEITKKCDELGVLL